jgi:hypothetical protein
MALRGGARNVIQWLREDHKQLDRAFKMSVVLGLDNITTSI